MPQVIVFCQNRLLQAAWLALLQKQPGLTAVSVAATIPDLQIQTNTGQPTAVFVDVPAISPDFVAGMSPAVANGGLLFLVDEYEVDEMITLLQAGATGFIQRNAAVPDLARAIIAVGRGEIVLPPDKASQVMLGLARGGGQKERPLANLTDREKEVLTLLAQGLTNKDIAQTLILSVRTVEAHLRNIYGKLQVASRTEAALWAIHHGFAPENR